MKKIFLILIAILLLVAGCGSEPKKELKNFGMDAQTFIKKFNEITLVANNDFFLIKNPQINNAEVRKVYQYEFNKDCIILIGELQDAKKVDYIATASVPNSPTNAAVFMVVHAAIVGVLHPDIPIDKRLDVLHKLKVLGSDKLKGLDETTTVGNVKYTAIESQGVLKIGIEPK